MAFSMAASVNVPGGVLQTRSRATMTGFFRN